MPIPIQFPRQIQVYRFHSITVYMKLQALLGLQLRFISGCSIPTATIMMQYEGYLFPYLSSPLTAVYSYSQRCATPSRQLTAPSIISPSAHSPGSHLPSGSIHRHSRHLAEPALSRPSLRPFPPSVVLTFCLPLSRHSFTPIPGSTSHQQNQASAFPPPAALHPAPGAICPWHTLPHNTPHLTSLPPGKHPPQLCRLKRPKKIEKNS